MSDLLLMGVGTPPEGAAAPAASSYQMQVPGGAFINMTGTNEQQIPGSQYVNETQF